MLVGKRSRGGVLSVAALDRATQLRRSFLSSSLDPAPRLTRVKPTGHVPRMRACVDDLSLVREGGFLPWDFDGSWIDGKVMVE
eukprot:3112902-Pyramimonas_sp.AAC.1